MLNNRNNKGCGFEDLIVSYIYDEVTTAERRKFEGHLLDCSGCTDEFASISNARFSVFEWQKETFAELATPEIVIPYPSKLATQESVGFLVGLRGLLGGFGLHAAAAASILLLLGLGFVALTLLDNGGEQIASNLKVDMPSLEKPLIQREPSIGTPVAPSAVVSQNEVKERPAVLSEPKVIKAVSGTKRSIPSRPLTAETANRIRPVPQKSKAPVLSDFDENDDKSLRLTDLFGDEIGSRF